MDKRVWSKIDGRIASCRKLVQEVQGLTKDLVVGGSVFFRDLSLRDPTRGCAELVFLRTVFWLSSLFHECAGRPIRFCLRQSQFPDGEGKSKTFLEELRCLRTHAAHNLDSSSESDRLTEYTCVLWYKRICRSKPPMGDRKWAACVATLLDDAVRTLERLHSFLSFLRSSGDADLLVEDLARAVVGQVSPYAFDSVVASVADDLGRTDLNLERFRAKNFLAWCSELDKLHDGYEFRVHARLIVEKSFLDTPERPPVSGRDIIEQLGVDPGPEVRRLLELARQRFELGVRDKAMILQQLRDSLVEDRGTPAPVQERSCG